MGTTLTGTTPQDTYDSLIKVTDNGPLSGTAKYLSDGLGNDSVLALSTSRVGIGTATPNQPLTVGATNGYPVIDFENSNTAYGDVGFQVDKMVLSAYTTTPLTFWTNSNERMRITSTGNVGIGTSSPSGKLHVSSTGDTYFVLTGGPTPLSYSFLVDANDMRLFTGVGDSEKLRVTSSYLRLASGMGGIQFNGDTAAANALDDYEEGTFTPALTAGTSAPTGVTYAYNGGRYTKIGRLVNITLGFLLSSKGTGGSGAVRISGLPFTAPVYGAYQEPNARLIGGAFSTTSIASSAYAFVTGSSTFIEGRVGQNVDTALDYGEITDSTYLSFNLTYYI
jgi:hypothetical protein